MTDLLAGPFENRHLAEALAERRPMGDVARLLLETLILVPVRVDDEGRRLLVAEHNADGAAALPVFTSTDTVAEWNSETGVAVVEGAALLDMAASVAAQAVLLDPAGPTPAVIPIEFLSRVAGEHGRRLAEGRELGVGAPAEPPPAVIVEAVRSAVRATDGVAAAYLFQMAGHGTVPALVAGVELARDRDEAAVMPAFVQRLGAALPPGRAVDAVPLAGDLLAAVRDAVPAVTA
jgi:hypothetical protein